MIRIFIVALSLICGMCGLVGCSKGKVVQQGVIEYAIDYPDEISSRPISNILPEKLQVYFSENRMKMRIKGELNLFSLDFLAKAGGDSCFTLFKMINKKMVIPMEDHERWFLFNDSHPFKHQVFRDSIKNIAGLNCFKVQIFHEDSPDVVYDTWFTEEVSLTSQMMRTPFAEIDGVPMVFEIKYNGLLYCFHATSFSNELGNECMDVPEGYELASYKDVKDVVDLILN